MGMIIAVDFDETVCTGTEEVPNAIDSLVELRRRGHELMLFTNRTGVTLKAAFAWLEAHQFRFDGVNGGLHWWQRLFFSASKPYADKFIDDRNVGCPLRDFNGVKVVDWSAIMHPDTIIRYRDIRDEQ